MARALRYGVPLALGVAVVVVLRLTLLAPEPVTVRAAAVERGRVEQTVTNSRAGTVKTRHRAKLSPEVGGRVVEIPFREGERVPAGAVVLRLDDAMPRAQLEVAQREQAAAEAQSEQACKAAEQARREVERNRRLAVEGIVSTDLLERLENAEETSAAACRAARRTAERSQAAVDLVRAELERTVLRAPFEAVVAELSIEVGEWATPSPPALPVPPVLDLLDADAIYVTAPMDEVDSARLAVGQAVKVTLDPFPGQEVEGTLQRIAPYVLDVEQQNRTVEIEVGLADGFRAVGLLPGTSADVEVVLEVREDVLRIPSAALIEGERVWVVEDGRLAERPIEVGLRNWDFTEVVGGLVEGEQVVLSLDRAELEPGSRVRVEGS